MGLLIIKTSDFSYIIVLAVYGVDSVLTITHRLLLKENIFDAHRKHAYQLMANELKIKHVIVSTFYATLQILIFAGYIVFKSYSYLYLGLILFTLSIVYILFKKKFFYLHGK